MFLLQDCSPFFFISSCILLCLRKRLLTFLGALRWWKKNSYQSWEYNIFTVSCCHIFFAASGGKDQEEEGGDSEDEDLAEADEDESDLDLAWKMLDVARAIAEKHSGDTMDKVDVLSALAEVALERGT